MGFWRYTGNQVWKKWPCSMKLRNTWQCLLRQFQKFKGTRSGKWCWLRCPWLLSPKASLNRSRLANSWKGNEERDLFTIFFSKSFSYLFFSHNCTSHIVQLFLITTMMFSPCFITQFDESWMLSWRLLKAKTWQVAPWPSMIQNLILPSSLQCLCLLSSRIDFPW